MGLWGPHELLVAVSTLAWGPRIELTYLAFVSFKGNVTFAAAATDKEDKSGRSGGGRARVQVEMRGRYAVSRFIVFPIKRKVLANTGYPTQYTLFHRTDPHRIFGPSLNHVSRFRLQPRCGSWLHFAAIKNSGFFET